MKHSLIPLLGVACCTAALPAPVGQQAQNPAALAAAAPPPPPPPGCPASAALTSTQPTFPGLTGGAAPAAAGYGFGAANPFFGGGGGFPGFGSAGAGNSPPSLGGFGDWSGFGGYPGFAGTPVAQPATAAEAAQPAVHPPSASATPATAQNYGGYPGFFGGGGSGFGGFPGFPGFGGFGAGTFPGFGGFPGFQGFPGFSGSATPAPAAAAARVAGDAASGAGVGARDTASPAWPLAANDVEVEVHAVGLNFKDLLVAMGEIDQPGFGHEAAETIARPHQRWARCQDPGTLQFEIAAGLPIIYGTVIYSLGHVARLRAGEKILIHAAAGGIGQAAIQYAQHKGAEIFVTLSSLEKKQFIMDTFQISADHIFSSRDLNFAAGIKRIAPAGVDVVLNSLSGEALRQSWACVAPFGRFVEIGKLDLQAGSKLDMTPFLHNVFFTGVDLNALAETRPETCQELLQETVQLWLDKKIHEARPTRVLGYGQLKQGLRALQTGTSIGKITLVPSNHPVSVIPTPLAPLTLHPNASFILAGGLGGIGRSIALRLARRGAKHLVFLSRSATVHEAGQRTITKLKDLGCTSHVFQCDVSDKSRLSEVIAQIRETLPPIRGCIQSSFVLKDRAFDSMTYEEWQTALAPKVSGSWNLHSLLPDVDFFVLLSSSDALARHRTSQGMHGASVNLGAVVGIGFIAENAEYAGKHTFKMANPQTEDEVLATIEYLIVRRYHPAPSPDIAQLVCGLRTPASYSRGNEPLPTHLKYPMFAQLPAAALSNVGPSGLDTSQSAAAQLQDLLQAATTPEEAANIIHKAMRRKMADLLNISEDSIDDSLNVRANGVDSLIEMEFRTWFARELSATVPLKDLAKDLTQLSARLVTLSPFTKFC
ncbi:KR domain-containing protein [Aspergillus spectabilis]